MDANNRNHWFLDPGPLSPWIDEFAADCSATFTVRMRDNQDENPVCRDLRRA